MNVLEKDEILHEVSSVLNICHQIVRRLSSLECHPDSVPAASVNLFPGLNTTQVPFDDNDDDDYNYWWDTNYPPSQFYSLVYEDDDLSLFSFDQEMAEETYYDTVKVGETYYDTEKATETYHDKMTAEFINETEMMAAQFINESEMARESIEKPDEVRDDLLFVISVACPNAIYDPKWKEKALRTLIDPQLLSAWDNAFTIFDDEDQCDDGMVQYQPPVISYHTIDIYNVNQRFIENIPRPNRYPVLGVSNDPDFYHKLYETEPYKTSLKFLKPHPFGSKYGYETNIGIVPPSTEPIHGYVWSEERGGSFVLHAVKPGDAPGTNSRRRRA